MTSPSRSAFLLTRPLRDVTYIFHSPKDIRKFLLTRPLRDVTKNNVWTLKTGIISTHTPLAGRDKILEEHGLNHGISTHTPLAGRDQRIFLLSRQRIISTHTPLAGRDFLGRCRCDVGISTHTPLAGRDRYILHVCSGTPPHIGTDLFLPTSFT